MVEEWHGEYNVDGLSLGQVHRLQFFLVVAEVHEAVLVDLRHVNALQEEASLNVMGKSASEQEAQT